MRNPNILIISLILIIMFITSVITVSFCQGKSIEELYFQGVDLLENKKQYEEALTCFQQIVELNPKPTRGRSFGRLYAPFPSNNPPQKLFFTISFMA